MNSIKTQIRKAKAVRNALHKSLEAARKAQSPLEAQILQIWGNAWNIVDEQYKLLGTTEEAEHNKKYIARLARLSKKHNWGIKIDEYLASRIRATGTLTNPEVRAD